MKAYVYNIWQWQVGLGLGCGVACYLQITVIFVKISLGSNWQSSDIHWGLMIWLLEEYIKVTCLIGMTFYLILPTWQWVLISRSNWLLMGNRWSFICMYNLVGSFLTVVWTLSMTCFASSLTSSNRRHYVTVRVQEFQRIGFGNYAASLGKFMEFFCIFSLLLRVSVAVLLKTNVSL